MKFLLYISKICGKSFSDHHAMQRHIYQSHIAKEEQPFQCPVPKCAWYCTERSDYGKHKITKNHKANQKSSGIKDEAVIPNRKLTRKSRTLKTRQSSLIESVVLSQLTAGTLLVMKTIHSRWNIRLSWSSKSMVYIILFLYLINWSWCATI